jgi:nitrate/nitrite transporter NarK
VLGSSLAALAPSTEILIAARVVQGAGGAILVPLTLTLISGAFPAEQRGTAIGTWGGVTGLGVAAGPVVGGAIVQGISWQWILLGECPDRASRCDGIGAAPTGKPRAEAAAGHRRPRPRRCRAVRPDLGAGQGRPITAGERPVIGSLIAGVALMAGFLAWELRARYPMPPLAHFRRRAFSTANGVVFFQFVSLIGSLFFITQLFQIGLGYSPLAAGLRILVWMATPMVVAPIAGALADRIGNQPFMLGGLVLQASGLGGVFGVAILAAVFAAHGGSESTASFFAGFRPAEWVAAGAAGVMAAALAPSKSRLALTSAAVPAAEGACDSRAPASTSR